MHGCIVIVLAVHIHIHIYMIYGKTRILLNPLVGLLLGCKSSYTFKTRCSVKSSFTVHLRRNAQSQVLLKCF